MRTTRSQSMKSKPDLTGKVFGRWIVLGIAAPTTWGGRRWRCLCACGCTKDVLQASLLQGRSTSCGCLRNEQTSQRLRVHGHTSGGKITKTFNAWNNMLSRCTNPRRPDYKHYGGRGIVVCERWRDFRNFLIDMGECPRGCSLDRHPDKNGNYEPGNCRWATQSQQMRNTRRNRHVTIRGETKCLAEWAEIYSFPYMIAYNRLELGWEPDRAFTQPVRHVTPP